MEKSPFFFGKNVKIGTRLAKEVRQQLTDLLLEHRDVWNRRRNHRIQVDYRPKGTLDQTEEQKFWYRKIRGDRRGSGQVSSSWVYGNTIPGGAGDNGTMNNDLDTKLMMAFQRNGVLII
ncbi:hypothetical protein CIPAW_01G194300 [Carya illinoinensis]|uniref:Uncharacterized protein n=1 Tax=Carya illinoinensis TaxID=32201 RepID=A0A8T1RPV0_CARIL|nr:hypothetical protein CIPAW_01G194300 [Carya illinoinensis]